MTNYNNEQEKFWAEDYNQEYIRKNSNFDHKLGSIGWSKMLSTISAENLNSYLECGCNIGRNIEQIKILYPHLKPSVLDVNLNALEYAKKKYAFEKVFHGSIIDCDFSPNSFDLVFTQGVLIHVNPEHLLPSMEKMFHLSSRYILIGEYFNQTPTSITYQGEENKLFKRDFGKLFIENFDVSLVDYGFLWSHIYVSGGFDDITWWMLEKNNH